MLTLKNDRLSMAFDPLHGGKVASLRFDGREMLAMPPAPVSYAPKPGDPFDENAAWGWDDVFPAMGGGADADHGVVWTTPMRAEHGPDGARLWTTINGCAYEKTLSLLPDGVRAAWKIENRGKAPAEGLWVCHLLWALREDTEFFYPEGYAPVVIDTEEPADALARTPDAPMWTKYWGRTGEGAFGFRQDGLRVTLRADGGKLPYLGFWINRGAWPCSDQFAFEPSTSFYDTRERARASGTLLRIEPGESINFTLTITISRKEGAK